MIFPLAKRNFFMAQKRIMLVALGVILIVSGIACLIITGSRGRPSYQGKSLDYWLSQMPITFIVVMVNPGGINTMVSTGTRVQFGPPTTPLKTYEQPEDCLRAMKAMGTNALPTLLSKLQTRDSSWIYRIDEWEIKVGIKRFILEPAILTRSRAITRLEALQPLPENTLQQLRALSTNADPNIAESAKYVLLGKPVDFGVGTTINPTTPARRE